MYYQNENKKLFANIVWSAIGHTEHSNSTHVWIPHLKTSIILSLTEPHFHI